MFCGGLLVSCLSRRRADGDDGKGDVATEDKRPLFMLRTVGLTLPWFSHEHSSCVWVKIIVTVSTHFGPPVACFRLFGYYYETPLRRLPVLDQSFRDTWTESSLWEKPLRKSQVGAARFIILGTDS